uniref:Poly [ADP-ribose] polymerase 12-like n=1 Tax=Lepisosteus oculatus TaxID=7918 RepID=W5NI67_LEPOC|nr:PREDICTED: poly [ADP-ribose] polymerase 12-like isoform X1 [Lepisosteus oculatus]
MAVDDIIGYAMKILCSNGGSLEYKQLKDGVEHLKIPDSVFSRILRNSRNFIIVPTTEDTKTSRDLNFNTKIIARTSVRLCKDYSGDGCGGCKGVHICKSFLSGKCGNQRGTCQYSHDLHSPHNLQVLRDNQLLDLNIDELFLLLFQNDPTLLPEVCMHYNKGNGEFGCCSFKGRCKKLHLCLHFLQGNCKFGAACKRSHSIDERIHNVLKESGLSVHLIKKLPLLLCNNHIINKEKSSTEGKNMFEKEFPLSKVTGMEICLFHIRKQCTYKDKCLNVHYTLPYKWEIFSGLSWTELPNMEKIEEAFCNPENTKSYGSPAVDFLTMTQRSSNVRRLSTVSSVTKPAHFILTTNWLWYWKDEYGKWNEYGKETSTHNASSVTSEMIEKAFLEDGNSILTFSAGKHQYTLDFKNMHQQNQSLQTQREVCRRPKFISVQDVERILKSESSGTPSFPVNWDPTAVPGCGFKLVPLSISSEEFNDIQNLFKKTMPMADIHTIERIQNLHLWEAFQMKKQVMKKRNGGIDVDERCLFHGTNKSYIHDICEQNFDWRICGKHATAYGKGSYFARDAKYSHHYTDHSSVRAMFVTRVLVGTFVKGCTEYLVPPNKPGSTSTNDSCVDNPNDPSIFVIFEKDQVYPEYIIHYSQGLINDGIVKKPQQQTLNQSSSYQTQVPQAPKSPGSATLTSKHPMSSPPPTDSTCTIL